MSAVEVALVQVQQTVVTKALTRLVKTVTVLPITVVMNAEELVTAPMMSLV